VHAESKEAYVEQEHDPHSTETIARQLLDPSISEDEEREYHGCVLVFVFCTLAKSGDICPRYIDQCQDLMDAPINGGERRGLEIYQQAVWTSAGELGDSAPDEAFFTYVERGTTHYLDGVRVKEGKEGLPVHFNYERWLGGGTHIK
jgi:hypothetical protein